MKPQEKVLPYIFFLFSLVFALWLIKALNISYPLEVKTSTVSSELAVVGEGKVDVTPDTVYIDAGVSVSNVPTADEAQKAISEINNKIIAAMKKLGLEEKDISTSNYSVSPNYSYKRDEEKKITGYNGSATLTIKVKDKDLASKVIVEATNAGANRIHGARFVVDKPEKYREEARNKAIQNAKDQAQKLAKTLGIKLGKVVNIVESSPGSPVYRTLRTTAVEDLGGGGPELEPGSQTITSTVTLYFEKR